jgi:alpha-galactosidase
MQKRILSGILIAVTAISLNAAPQVKQSDSRPTAEEKNLVSKFIGAYFTKGKHPPVSFIYNKSTSSSLLVKWDFKEEVKIIDKNKTKHIIKYTDSQTGLVLTVECLTFEDYPAIEWIARFKNTSQNDSPIIENIMAVDAELMKGEKGNYFVHRAKGSNAERSDFAPIDEPLNPNGEISFGPTTGRSSDNVALPFFNIESPGKGVIAGIGWSGKWKADIKRNANETISLTSGMATTHLKLLPGEEIRTPSILLFYWQGNDRMIGHNQFRRFILKHHTPQKDSKPVTLPLGAGIAFGGPSPCNEYSCATETYAIAMVYRMDQFGIRPDIGWIDAGWYEGSENGWWRGVGNWFPNKKNFPNGFRPISDPLKNFGMGFLLWFEPERVFEGTWLDMEHQEWLIKFPGNSNRLLNLGNPDARRWLTDHISGMLDKEGITHYRQDFNFDPLPYWQANDDSNRIGMTEIRHIEGLYAFWDSLLARKPGLVIDNCASGGRRIDLETISRSAPLWRTDYSYFEPNGYQCHTYGINYYLPCSGTGNNNPDPYMFRSSMSSALVLGWDINQSTFPLLQAKKSIDEFRLLHPYFYGDYYPLTDYSTSDNAWMAYQFNRPESSDGVILAFRRNATNVTTINIKLKGLIAGENYEVNYVDYGISQVYTANKLSDGIDIKIPQAPGSLLITYNIIKK